MSNGSFWVRRRRWHIFDCQFHPIFVQLFPFVLNASPIQSSPNLTRKPFVWSPIQWPRSISNNEHQLQQPPYLASRNHSSRCVSRQLDRTQRRLRSCMRSAIRLLLYYTKQTIRNSKLLWYGCFVTKFIPLLRLNSSTSPAINIVRQYAKAFHFRRWSPGKEECGQCVYYA